MPNHRPGPYIFQNRHAHPHKPETGGKIALAGAIGALAATAIFVAATMILGATDRPAACAALTPPECAAAITETA